MRCLHGDFIQEGSEKFFETGLDKGSVKQPAGQISGHLSQHAPLVIPGRAYREPEMRDALASACSTRRAHRALTSHLMKRIIRVRPAGFRDRRRSHQIDGSGYGRDYRLAERRR